MTGRTYALPARFSLRAPDGTSIELESAELRVGEQDGRIVEGRLVVLVSPESYSRIDRERLFHLAPDVRGPNMHGEFDQSGPIELELRPAPELLARAAGLSDADESDPLRETESWYALNVTQQDGQVKTGYSTDWMRSDALERSTLRAVADALHGLGWPVVEGELGGVATVETNYEGKNGRWTCQVQSVEDRGVVLFVSLLPEPAPADTRREVLRLLNRLNWWLMEGSFEMHEESGAMRFRTTQLVPEGEHLTVEAARDCLQRNTETTDHCVGEVTRVMYGLSTAEAAEASVKQ